MNRLAAVSLRNRALIALATVMVAIFGTVSVSSLKQELIPSLEFPVVAVVAPYPGSSPEVVDELVTGPIEESVGGVDGLESTDSTSSAGLALVVVTLTYGTDLDAAQQEIQQAVNGLGTSLPQTVEPTVLAGSLDDFPVVQLAVTSDTDTTELAARLEQVALPELRGVEGVREVTLTGTATPRVEVRLDQPAAAAAKVDAAVVAEALRANGSLVPAGSLETDDQTLPVQVGSSLTSIADVRKLPLTGADGQSVQLGDVADVRAGTAPTTSVSRTDGQDSLSISITKTPDGNTVDISHDIAELLPEIEEQIGDDAAFSVVFDQAPFIEKSIEDLATEGGLGLLFAIVVILVFLLSVRSTLVTAVSIPLSLLVTFIGLQVGGYSLNILTLGGLTVAIGRVVDDSIVVIENIKRHLSYGEEKARAIIDAVKEVAGAITSSTLATMAVFLPIAVVGGQVGELFRPFAVTVSLALAASLLVALTIIPVLASWFLRAPAGPVDVEQVRAQADAKERRGLLQRTYVPVLRGTVAHPVITLVVAVAILAGTIAMTPLLKTSFLGSSGENSLSISQELPAGASLEAQSEAAREVEEVLADVDGVETVQTTAGGEGFAALVGGGGASFSVTTDEAADQEALADTVRDRLGELDSDITVASGGAGAGASTIDVIVTAPDDQQLEAAGEQVLQAVEDTEGTTDVTSNAAAAQPTLAVRLQDRAYAAGLTDTAVAQLLGSVLQPPPVGQAVVDGVSQDVVVVPPASPSALGELRGLPVGPDATLDDVSTVQVREVATSITRIDGVRSITISATPADEDLGTLSTDLQATLDGLDLPEGAEATLGGVTAEQEEAFAQLGLAMLIAIAIVYLVMVGTFRSLLQPLILLVSVPFAATGVILLQVVTGIPLGVPSLIGVLMLIGVVVTNAIVLIDLVNQYREDGQSVMDAVVNGGRQRLRPILMTAAATILALTPMAFGVTGGSAFISQPLAIVVIGGLVSSTLLTLVLVPVLYLLAERGRERISARRARRRDRRSAAATA